MCGIAGIFNFEPEHIADDVELRLMLSTLRHRGPENEGVFLDGSVGLGHRRLSIIDRSSAGHQPMANEDASLWLVFNGEIYNEPELRTELAGRGHRFRSCSDAEVVLHLYEESGTECLHRFNGMFAFALWDRHAQRLWLARDRFGIKPLYYLALKDRFVFASEIKALLRVLRQGVEVDPIGLAQYLTFQFCLADRTLFRDVRSMQPAQHGMLLRDGRLDLQTYWDLDFTTDLHHSSEYFQEELSRLLDDSVRLQLRADVEVGTHLSGGLDSSVVTCLAARHAPSLHAFTGGFLDVPGFDESVYARTVSKHASVVHHEVYPTPSDFVARLPSLVYAMDQPAAGPGAFAQYCVSELASHHVTVVLGGQGGDELFGGYTRYLIAYLEECLKGGIEGTQQAGSWVVTFDSILPNLRQLDGYQSMLAHFWKEGLFEPSERRYFRLIDRSQPLRAVLAQEVFAPQGYDPFESYLEIFRGGACHSLINRMTRFDLKTLLPALLHVEDRTSMAASIESRVPLLDHRIAELTAAMPPAVKFAAGRSKHIFREVAQQIVPKAITARPDKMGFPVPLAEWSRRGPVRDLIHDTLLHSGSRVARYARGTDVSAALQTDGTFGRTLWALLSLELWMRTFLDAPLPTPAGV